MNLIFSYIVILKHMATATSSAVDPVEIPGRPLFVWVEWPEIYTAREWRSFFDQLLGFSLTNRGNFVTSHIVIRVMNPQWEGLFPVSPDSAFYTDFLARLPEGIELRIYPYVFTKKYQRKWAAYSGTGRALEGVFKYANDWNIMLASMGNAARFSAVVLDHEEEHGFIGEQDRVSTYKEMYGIPILGVALGFDAVSHSHKFPFANEFYLEMYDFYKVDATDIELVETEPGEGPETFLTRLKRLSLVPSIARTYRDPRLHFMWSVQSRTNNCIYPLEGVCGQKNDFGIFSAPEFNTFLGMVQEQIPILSERSHGIFQFCFVPPSWL